MIENEQASDGGNIVAATTAVSLLVKHGAVEHTVELPSAACRVGDLKGQLEALTGLFARQQKLIYRGKVLDDGLSLSEARLASGTRIMLLQGAGSSGRATSSVAARQPTRTPAQATSAAPTPAPRSSSVLADKLASMAAAAASSRSSGSEPASMPERRAAWAKTGVIALRDLQLEALRSEWFAGLADTARAADVSHNRLTSLPAELLSLTGLGSLKLAGNRLVDAGMPWPGLTSSLTALTSLSLGGNQLTLLPACLGAMSGLLQLSAEGNRLSCIESGALGGLQRLEVLQLAGNMLCALPDDLGEARALVALNASSNSLAALPDSVTQLTRLQVLALDSNRLAALPSRLFVGCCALTTLSAHDNPLTVEALRAAEGYQAYDERRRARASKQLDGRVMADTARAFSEGADVLQWERWASGATGLGTDGSGRAGGRR